MKYHGTDKPKSILTEHQIADILNDYRDDSWTASTVRDLVHNVRYWRDLTTKITEGLTSPTWHDLGTTPGGRPINKSRSVRFDDEPVNVSASEDNPPGGRMPKPKPLDVQHTYSVVQAERRYVDSGRVGEAVAYGKRTVWQVVIQVGYLIPTYGVVYETTEGQGIAMVMAMKMNEAYEKGFNDGTKEERVLVQEREDAWQRERGTAKTTKTT